MRKLTVDDQKEFYYTISPQNKPRLYINIGETIIVETEDASSGHIRKLGDKRDYVKINNKTGICESDRLDARVWNR